MVACQGVNCAKEAKQGLSCPKCDECVFEKKWLWFADIDSGSRCRVISVQTTVSNGVSSHKTIHAFLKLKIAEQKVHADRNAAENPDGTVQPWPEFRFSGKMRPHYPLSDRRKVPDHIPKPDYALNVEGNPWSERKMQTNASIPLLEGEKLETMREACRLGREVLNIAIAAVRPGITTDSIDEIVHNATIERNAYPSPLNYRGFPKSVCLSLNEVICHGIPDQRILLDGDIMNIDISLYYKGFHSDLNATVPVGNISPEAQKLITTTRACLDAAIAICKPGVAFRDVGDVIQPMAEKEKFGVVKYYTGHGVGAEFHCAPTIVHAKNKGVGTMKKGMVFTIEPMINGTLNHNLIHWPDDWTTTTTDGALSAQFEETILITEDGCEVLTAA